MIGSDQGVGVPLGQIRESQRVEPFTLLNLMPVHMFAVRYGDGAGHAIKEIWYEVDGEFYVPPGSEMFTAKLNRVTNQKLSEQAKRGLARLRKAVGQLAGLADADAAAEAVSEQVESQVDV